MCGTPVYRHTRQCENCGERLVKPEISEPYQIDPLLVRQFHAQSLWLCSFWILLSLWPTAFGIVQMYHWHDWMFDIFWETVFIIFGLALIRFGFACRARRPWTPIVSLILSYTLLLMSLATLNLCVTILFVVLIVQSHSVFNTARKMRNAGIPLDTRIPG